MIGGKEGNEYTNDGWYKCCQYENVASTKSNFQFAYAKATADKLEIGNTSTMATIFTRYLHGPLWEMRWQG